MPPCFQGRLDLPLTLSKGHLGAALSVTGNERTRVREAWSLALHAWHRLGAWHLSLVTLDIFPDSFLPTQTV